MLKKIILPLILLIFTHQDFYGVEKEEVAKNAQVSIWKTINNYVNGDESDEKQGKYPKLWLLWAILDNVPFQYGNSRIWKHGEAYYGLSNGIGFFPSILNFGWLKIGIGDAHINVINAIINYIRIYVQIKFDYYHVLANPNENKHENPVWLNSLKWWLFYTLVNDIQLLSFKFFNCVKIKIISIGAFVAGFITDCYIFNDDNEWYFNFNFEKGRTLTVSKNYLILSPRIEINISGIINYFSGK